jgi:hypothetical protein
VVDDKHPIELLYMNRGKYIPGSCFALVWFRIEILEAEKTSSGQAPTPSSSSSSSFKLQASSLLATDWALPERLDEGRTTYVHIWMVISNC